MSRLITAGHYSAAKMRCIKEKVAQACRFYDRQTDPRPLETTLAELTLVWGLWLMLPMNSFAAAPSFAAMGHVLPEGIWGLIAAFLGALMLRGILFEQRRPTRWGFIFGAGLWLLVVVSLLLVNWTTTGTPIYAVIALKFFQRGART